MNTSKVKMTVMAGLFVLFGSIFMVVAEGRAFDVNKIPNACSNENELPEEFKLTWPLPGQLSDYDRTEKKHYSKGSNGTSYKNHYLLDFGVPWHNEKGGSWRRNSRGHISGQYVLNKYIGDTVSDGERLHTGIDIVLKSDRSLLRGTNKVMVNDFPPKDKKNYIDDSGDDKEFHTWGLPVYPVYPGTVKKVDSGEKIEPWVGVISIDHTHTTSKGFKFKFNTTYWHVEPIVKEGTTVNINTLIGTIANLDNESVYDRDHLHFSIRKGHYSSWEQGSYSISSVKAKSYNHINPNTQCFNEKNIWKPNFDFIDFLKEDIGKEIKIIESDSDTEKNNNTISIESTNKGNLSLFMRKNSYTVKINEEKINEETIQAKLTKQAKLLKHSNDGKLTLNKLTLNIFTDGKVDKDLTKFTKPVKIQIYDGDTLVEEVFYPFKDFKDLKTDSFKILLEFWRMGAISGYSDGTFGADTPITRAEFAKIMVLAIRKWQKRFLPVKPDRKGKFPFTDEALTYKDTDKDSKKWQIPYVKALYQSGSVKGVTDTEFEPDSNITIGQMAKMVLLGMMELKEDKLKMASNTKTEKWADIYMACARKFELIDSDKKSSSDATREQTMLAIYKAQKYTDSNVIKEKSYLDVIFDKDKDSCPYYGVVEKQKSEQ
ncbi:MAG: S-layer homology domain-containing protein [Candidatus Parabeggiatoa sp.]|nr:S-layer homology domain-containing protein [Candidatus Parabeggiatoa sp.]